MQRHQAAWHHLWSALGIPTPDPGLLTSLLQRYAEPQRKYHTLQHLDACLEHFASLRARALHPAEVELALWFHDAIYEVGVAGNEARSADWARDALRKAGAPAEVAERVHALVMVTCHDRAPRTSDQEILLDVDLAILGAAEPIFDAYEAQIRAEHAVVPEPAFRARRHGILRQFLDRPRIYHTARFHGLFEATARDNLARSIARLTPSPNPSSTEAITP
jgi:predicted metal-dependent HD superfamily phosphohydrolase